MPCWRCGTPAGGGGDRQSVDRLAQRGAGGRAILPRRDRRAGAGRTRSSPSRASARSCISPGRSWFPKSVEKPLDYYRNNTVASHALISARWPRRAAFHLLLDRRDLRRARGVPIEEGDPKQPINPYGGSKLMTERMLADASAAHPLNYGALRYFNVAGADPEGARGPDRQGLDPSDQGRGRGGGRQARPCRGLRHRLSDRPTAPASAITSTSATLPRRMSRRSSG